jgi:small subunit ribosomal protein S8
MLTRIRNAIAVNKVEVSMPYSKAKADVAKIMQECGFIDRVDLDSSSSINKIRIQLASEGQNTRINSIERLSKPGQRLYAKSKEIPSVKNGRGIVIISTSKGVMSGQTAKQQHLGGELICQVY